MVDVFAVKSNYSSEEWFITQTLVCLNHYKLMLCYSKNDRLSLGNINWHQTNQYFVDDLGLLNKTLTKLNKEIWMPLRNTAKLFHIHFALVANE